MLIGDVKVTTPEGKEFTFLGVGTREMTMPVPGLPVMEFSSALGTALGVVFIKAGMVMEFSNQSVTSSQVADNGLVKKPKESDGMVTL